MHVHLDFRPTFHAHFTLRLDAAATPWALQILCPPEAVDVRVVVPEPVRRHLAGALPGWLRGCARVRGGIDGMIVVGEADWGDVVRPIEVWSPDPERQPDAHALLAALLDTALEASLALIPQTLLCVGRSYVPGLELPLLKSGGPHPVVLFSHPPSRPDPPLEAWRERRLPDNPAVEVEVSAAQAGGRWQAEALRRIGATFRVARWRVHSGLVEPLVAVGVPRERIGVMGAWVNVRQLFTPPR